MGFDTTYLPIIEIPVSSSYRRPKIHAQTASYVVCFMMSWSRHRRVPEVDSHVSKQSGRKPIGTAWHNANVQPVRELPQTSSGTSNRFLEISGKMVRSQRLEQEVKTNNPGEHEKSDVQKMQIMTELIEKQRRIDKYWNLTWGFTKDYDYYGNYRPNHSNQSVASMEARAVPNTTAANYGFYMDSEQAVNIRNLERGMIREIRRS
ncbi:hypothetical protein CSKR_103220 [Clonorchis sinensis]|uniref:Uncharacterized protein n=1 Tax=Clonorchis sinensis TaxID=79923 RepID=A0A3R7C5T6_CLOSI|nr:hypothetical protein CSKR_103220 [Clonorchis sinensis]